MRRRPSYRRRGGSIGAKCRAAAAILALPVLVLIGSIWAASGLFDETALIAESGTAHASTTEDDLFPPVLPGSFGAVPKSALGVIPAISTEAALGDQIALALETEPSVRSRTVLSRHGVLLGVTRALPEDSSMLGHYINVRMVVRPRGDGMKVTRMAVGRYEIPGGWIPAALTMWRDWLPGAPEALSRLAEIDWVDFQQGTVIRDAAQFGSESPEDKG